MHTYRLCNSFFRERARECRLCEWYLTCVQHILPTPRAVSRMHVVVQYKLSLSVTSRLSLSLVVVSHLHTPLKHIFVAQDAKIYVCDSPPLLY